MTTVTWTLPGKNEVRSFTLYDDNNTYDSTKLYGGQINTIWTLETQPTTTWTKKDKVITTTWSNENKNN